MMKMLQIILLFSAISSYAQPTFRSEYYAVIPFYESPLQPFRGAIPLSKEDASNRIHLRLDFDSLNRVIQSNVMIGNHLKAFEGFFALYINAPLIKVTYVDNQEIHHFYDHNGHPTDVMQNVYRKVYEKDDRGRNIRLLFQDEKGNPSWDFFGFQSYHWIYQEDGSVIEERYNKDGTLGILRGDFQFKRTRILFGPDGYPHVLQNVDSTGALVNSETGAAVFKYFYDSQGRFDRWEVYDKDGQPAIGPSNTAGEQNVHNGYYLESINFFDSEGNVATHWSGSEKWYMEYDSFGNRTRRVFKKENGNRMNGIGGYSESIQEWSKDGRWLLSEWYLDSDGVPFNNLRTGAAKIEYKRDSSGNVQDTIRYNHTGKKYMIRKD